MQSHFSSLSPSLALCLSVRPPVCLSVLGPDYDFHAPPSKFNVSSHYCYTRNKTGRYISSRHTPAVLIGRKFSCSLAQVANRPIVRQQLDAFTTCGRGETLLRVQRQHQNGDDSGGRWLSAPDALLCVFHRLEMTSRPSPGCTDEGSEREKYPLCEQRLGGGKCLVLGGQGSE